jgi:hypothetical protein
MMMPLTDVCHNNSIAFSNMPEVLERFCKAISQKALGYRNGIGAKRCVSSLNFVWNNENKLAELWLIYEKCVFAVFSVAEIVVHLKFGNCV